MSVVSAAAKGVLWLLGQTAATRILQALSQIALAWLLSPADFGEASLALAAAAIVSAFFSFGLEDVLLQRERGMRFWVGTVFWLSLAVGLLGGVALLAAAPVAALIFAQPELVGLVSVAALGAPIAALETIPSAMIRSRLRFHVLAMVSLGEAVAAIALSIGFAALGLGPYSLVLPAPIAAAARVAALWLIARPRIGSGGRRRWRLLLPAASASLGTRLLTIVMGQADYVVLGLVVREVEVGIYYFAYRLAIQSLRMIAGSLSAVLFPALVRYRDDPLRQMQAALVASQVLAVVVMPACLLQAALAGPALELFFAAKWQGAEPIIQLLSIGFAFDASSWAAGALLSARGEFGRGFTYMRRAATVFFAAITLGALAHGAIGVATAVAAYYVVVQPLYCFFVFARVGRVGWRDIAAIYAAPALVGAVAVLAPTLALATLHAPAWFQLCAVPPVAAAIYLPAIRLFCPKAYGLLRDQALGSRVRSAIA